jgi:signal transduction histidine kinase
MKNLQAHKCNGEAGDDGLLQNINNPSETDKFSKTLIQNISHEIRTPLNAIVGFSALISEKGQTEESKEYFADIIMKSSDNLLAILNDILIVSDIEAGKIKFSKSVLNLNSTLKSIYQKYYPATAEKGIGIRLETTLPESESTIYTDSGKFVQIFSILISNAIKFTEKGRIEFGYSTRNGMLVLHVSDTGIGISEKDLPNIFKRFYKAENPSVQSYKGTGLGLTIAKAYVKLLSGKIWVHSEAGKGTVVYFSIPYERAVPN